MQTKLHVRNFLCNLANRQDQECGKHRFKIDGNSYSLTIRLLNFELCIHIYVVKIAFNTFLNLNTACIAFNCFESDFLALVFRSISVLTIVLLLQVAPLSTGRAGAYVVHVPHSWQKPRWSLSSLRKWPSGFFKRKSKVNASPSTTWLWKYYN